MAPKSETIVLTTPCGEFRKRVFKGQRWIVVSQKDERAPMIVTAHTSEATAVRQNDEAYAAGCEVHFYGRADRAA